MTLKELSEVIPVSRGTIDRVLHGRGNVSDKSKALVLNALQEYGYVPNKAGTALAAIKKSYKIGLVLFKGRDLFNSVITSGVEQSFEHFKDYGFQLFKETVDNEMPDVQREAILRMAAQGMDAIIFCPLVSPVIRDAIQKLSKQGVLVLAVNSDIENSDRFCFVGHNNYQSGRAAASLAASIIGGRGNVLIAAGLQKFESHVHRLEGALSFFNKDAHEVDIVGIIWDSPDKIGENIKNATKDHQVDVILVLSTYTKEVIDALEDMELTDRVKVGVFDLNNSNAQYLKTNRINFIIDQQPILQGQMAMDIIGNYLISRQRPESGALYTKTTIIIKENLDDYLGDLGFMPVVDKQA